jgi:serine/threonine-protein kinase
MRDQSRIAELAEAVADGRAVDWKSAAGSASTEDDRELVASLRGLAAIGGFFGSLTTPSADTSRARPVLGPGTHWGPLRIIEHIGRGRFGDVYRAWDPALARDVALKLVASGDTPLDEHVVEEGRLMARVRHPNVITIHGAQRVDGVIGLWMEFIDGRSLDAETSDRGPFTADELVTTGIQLCHALAAVHGAGLVHRDVKASNVLRDRQGRLLLGDFGTGGEIDRDDSSLAGLMGTPAYLAPEIFRRQPATPQSDIYSLGVLLFHLATGRYPFAERSLAALRQAHAGGTPVAVSTLRPDLPAALAEVIQRSLDADASHRFQSADDMAHALEILATRDTKWLRRRVVTAVIAAAVAVGVGWLVWRPSSFSFKERDWVLVAAFENRTGNPLLDGAVEFALGLELGNSPVVNVVPRVRVDDTLALMRLPLDTRVDARVGREVALRDGSIRAVLAGQSDAVGPGVRFTAQVLDPRDGAVVSSVQEDAAAETDLIPAIARLAVKVRTRLGETLPALADTGPQMPRVTTRSLKALRLYQQALPDLFGEANPRVAEKLLGEAVREDPDFGVAHVARANAIWIQRFAVCGGRPRFFRAAEMDAHLEAAAIAASQVTVEDRYRIEAETAEIQRFRVPPGPEREAQAQGAVVALEALLRLRPDDVWALQTLLRLLSPEDPRVKPIAERVVSLRPNSPYALVQAATRLTDAGESGLAQSLLVRARPLLDLPTAERAGDGPAVNGRLLQFDFAWLANDMHEAAGMADELMAIWRRAPPEAAALHAEGIARRLLVLGQLDRSAEVASSLLRCDGIRELMLTSVVNCSRDPDRARRFLDQYGIDASFLGRAYLYVAAFLQAGRLQEARAAAEAMEKLEQDAALKALTWARIALAEEQPDRAIALLKSVRLEPRQTLPYYTLADAYAGVGDVQEAIRVLETAAAVPLRRLATAHHWLELQDRLARRYRQVGRFADADRVDATLRIRLTFADSNHPIKRRLSTQ